MTATTAAAERLHHSRRARRARTGGPGERGPKVLEHVLGWTLVLVLALFVTRAGLM
ncbi:SCO1431 family membrane protein [Streptomyces sp. NPDC060198]|uniref:SCO1431 family membrane protein n=1 Tax=Streptomyces sp. NPDC060198 TaxID=3347070 RepID=UPI0036585F21